MEICHCPELSRDKNGSAGIVELRLYLMWLGNASKPYSAKAKQVEGLFLCIA